MNQCGFINKPLDKEYVTRVYWCNDCNKLHEYSVVGKMFMGKIDAYNIKYKAIKDDMRRRHYKDLLQPIVDGKPNGEYIKAYGKLPFDTKKTS